MKQAKLHDKILGGLYGLLIRDTTACVTGGLAGILFGFAKIPKQWYDVLKGKEDVEKLLGFLEEF